MDLFVGEAIAASPKHIAHTMAGQPNGFSGIIRRVQGNLVTLQRTKFVGDNSTGHATLRRRPVLTTFRIAPYSRFSWQGGNQPAFSAGQLKAGQYVDGLWEGAVSHPIVTSGPFSRRQRPGAFSSRQPTPICSTSPRQPAPRGERLRGIARRLVPQNQCRDPRARQGSPDASCSLGSRCA